MGPRLTVHLFRDQHQSRFAVRRELGECSAQLVPDVPHGSVPVLEQGQLAAAKGDVPSGQHPMRRWNLGCRFGPNGRCRCGADRPRRRPAWGACGRCSVSRAHRRRRYGGLGRQRPPWDSGWRRFRAGRAGAAGREFAAERHGAPSVVSRKFVEQIPSVGSALRSSGENGCRRGVARSRVGPPGEHCNDTCSRFSPELLPRICGTPHQLLLRTNLRR